MATWTWPTSPYCSAVSAISRSRKGMEINMQRRQCLGLFVMVLSGCAVQPPPDATSFSLVIVPAQFAPAVPGQECMILVGVEESSAPTASGDPVQLSVATIIARFRSTRRRSARARSPKSRWSRKKMRWNRQSSPPSAGSGAPTLTQPQLRSRSGTARTRSRERRSHCAIASSPGLPTRTPSWKSRVRRNGRAGWSGRCGSW